MTKVGDQGSPPTTAPVICMALPVDVEGNQAVWIFTEFETQEPLDTLRDWLIPDHWPDWGGAMFKEMRPIGPVDLRPTRSSSAQQTHADYLEVVEIGGHRLETELKCELKSTRNWSAMSYDLDRSIGDMLQVDRGYLMAADVCGRRLVKALKVVGFTNTLLNTMATQVCPEWSEWVQNAVQQEAAELAGGADPTPGSVGDSGPDGSADDDEVGAFTGGAAQQWIDTMNDMAEFYAPFTVDVTERMWSGRYGQVDAANDASRLFQRLARDWSRAWQAGMENVQNWSEATVRPTAGADPGRSGRSVEHTTLLVEARTGKARVSISDLTRVGRRPATIKASDIRINPPVLEDAGGAYVTIETDTTRVPAGLYEGSLVAGAGGEQSPALFYVSHAQSPPAGD